MRWISGFAIFVLGTFTGMLLMRADAAQTEKQVGLEVMHVGIRVKNPDESLNFYTKTMHFRLAFTSKDDEGKLLSYHVQVSRNTFLELQPASTDLPPGLISHIGMRAYDLKSTIDSLRRDGIEVKDPFIGVSKALITNIVDPDGVHLELLELTPESSQGRAMAAWK
jgi:catechol 2,3-dioxygenase-like lactoylglutathione lyase family enzyme